MTSQFWWYVARASGMVAAVLLVLTLIWGLLITTKLIDRRGLPAWLTDLHRYLGGLTVAFIAVHLVSLVFDNFLVFSWSDLFVPFASSWKAGPVAWGIGAFWGMVVVEGSSLVQRKMKRSLWRGLHYLSYPVAVMAALHAVQAGTDAGNVVFRVVSIGLIGVLTALTIFRILYTPPKRSVVPGGGGQSAARAAAVRAAAARSAE
jgi:DMSO/TMAO reductase YedYZ heme-binding membrane subunit